MWTFSSSVAGQAITSIRSSRAGGMLNEFEVATNITSTNRNRLRRSDPETCGFVPGRALRAMRWRVAAKIHAHLVDFVEQEQRIRTDLAHILQGSCLAWNRCRCGDGREFEIRRARRRQRHADELPIGGLCDRLPSDGLAHAGRADQTKDGAFNLSTRLCTAKYSTMRSLTFSSP